MKKTLLIEVEPVSGATQDARVGCLVDAARQGAYALGLPPETLFMSEESLTGVRFEALGLVVLAVEVGPTEHFRPPQSAEELAAVLHTLAPNASKEKEAAQVLAKEIAARLTRALPKGERRPEGERGTAHRVWTQLDFEVAVATNERLEDQAEQDLKGAVEGLLLTWAHVELGPVLDRVVEVLGEPLRHGFVFERTAYCWGRRDAPPATSEAR